MKHLLITTAFVALTTTPLHAASEADTTATPAGETTFMIQDGQYDLSHLLGARVYITTPETAQTGLTEPHANWEDIGEIGEAFLSADGKISSLIVDVGGFLGIGERDVLITPDEVSLLPDVDSEGEFFVVYVGPRSDLEGKDAFDQSMMDDSGMISARSRMADLPPAGISEADDSATKDARDMAAEQADDTVAADSAYGSDFDAKVAELTASDVETLTADDLQGLTVYDAQSEHVGEISELIVSDDGKITNVIVDVGGFLGMGEKPVAMKFEELQFVKFTDNAGLAAKTSATVDELKAMESWGD